MAEARDTNQPDDERIRARLADPEIQRRISEVKGRVARGEFGTPLRGEELREFLDEQTRRHLGSR